jgi:hypothetical protein
MKVVDHDDNFESITKAPEVRDSGMEAKLSSPKKWKGKPGIPKVDAWSPNCRAVSGPKGGA